MTNAVAERVARAQPVIPVNDTLKLQLAKRGVDEFGWNTLKQSIFPGAQDASILMAIDYCKARRLDVLKKPVHIVPIWNSKEGKMVDTIWPSISELRTTAMRTGQYAGKDETKFGESVDQSWPPAGKRTEKVEVIYPEWAQVTVYRMVGTQRVAFVGPKVYWQESYAVASKADDAPNTMWQERPFGQIEKCAEAAALRAAFPEELGNDYSVDEARTFGGMKDVSPPKPESHAVSTGRAIAESMGYAKPTETPAKEVVIDATPAAPEEMPDLNTEEGRRLAAELDAEAAAQ